MSSAETHIPKDLHALADAELHIHEVLNSTADELAHAECFDIEQRAEVYAILEAIRTDADNHRRIIDLLRNRQSGEPSHA